MRTIHIAAGVLALLSGAVALYAPKGSLLHRRSGVVFAIAMLVMTSSAMISAGFLRPNKVNAIAGLVTFYLVSTGWLAMARSVEQARALLAGLMLVGLAGSAYAFSLGVEAMSSAKGLVDGIPAPPLFMFGVLGFFGGLGDARVLRAGNLAGAKRLVRHLWRMGFAMWIATASFFLGQAKLFPEPIRKSGLIFIPVLLVLLMLVYWVARVQIMRRRSMKDILGRRAMAARAASNRPAPEAEPVARATS